MSNNFSNKKILVTGAAGFIGSHLVKTLSTLNPSEIIALDSLGFGSWNNLGDTPKVTLLEMDFSEATRDELEKTMEGIDCVFHLAAEKHNQSIDQPDRVNEVNVSGTYRLYQAAAKAGVRKIVFTSSLYAYGKMQLPAMVETELPEPNTVYGVSKLAGEHLLREISKNSSTDFNIARLFFTYGTHQYAGMGYKSVIVKNFERILEGKAPIIFGDGKQALDYIYVSDVVDGLIKLAGPEHSALTLNLGSGKATNIIELTQAMLEVSGSELEPEYGDADWTHNTCRESDNTRAKKLLGWEPKVGIKEGLEKVYKWMNSYAGKV